VLSASIMGLVLGVVPAVQASEEGQPGRVDDTPKLTVRGAAELHKPADRLQLRVGVVTEDPAATTALQENSRRMEAVIKALEKVGVTEQEYETGHFSVRPVYSRRPRNADPEWRPQITGYEVTNSLVVRTKKLKLAGRLIEAANGAGANSIDISFDLADPRTHRDEAISTATANARSDAATLSRAAGVQLVRVLSVNLDQAGWRPPVPTMARGMAMAEAAGAAPPMRPGEVTVRATVTLVYEIK
jgi:uncharacterized protein YggE